MIERVIRYFDWISLCLISFLGLIGLAFIFSATYTQNIPLSLFLKKQLFGFVTGLILYIFFSCIDYRKLYRWGFASFLCVMALLIFTLIKGKIGMGAQRWIDLIIFKFQPSEIVKLFLPPFVVAFLMEQNDTPQYTFKNFVPILIILAISTLLIIKQPDLGTALLILFSGCTMLWFAGLSRYFFIASGICILICAPLAYNFLKPYQKKRITVFLGGGQQNKERYQLEQSKIAIGSGGFFGKGFLKGTQNKLHFLPESRTDFIFAVLCEEWGFFGALFVLLLYITLFLHLYLQINGFKHFHEQLLAFGLLFHIIFAAFINIAMIMDLLPVVGIPLPLMSYGISNLWITLVSLGCINSIIIREKSIVR